MTTKTIKLPKGNSSKETATSARLRVIVSIIAGVVGGVIVGVIISPRIAPLATWDIAALTFMIWIWKALHGRNAQQTADLATREDPGRAESDIVLVAASLASLGGVGVLLFQAHAIGGTSGILQVALGIVSVVISWAVIHTIYALRYASVYYTNKGGVDFNDSEPPCYSDFMYLAFTIGMTFQVSDNNFTNNDFRKMALRHALLSYLFGTVIVASTINLIAGLGK